MTGKSPKAGPEAPVAITKGTMDKLLDLKNPSDPIALLMFYTHAAIRQGTNQPYATTSFCAKGLKWGERKTRAAKHILVEKGLVEDVRGVDRHTGKTRKWYVRLPYLMKKTTLAVLDRVDCKNHPCSLPQGGRTTRVDFGQQLLEGTEELLKGTEENCLKKQKGSGEASPSPAASSFVQFFEDLLRETGYEGAVTDTHRKNWASTYDKLVRLDGKTDDEIRAICSWARNDEFWSKNFLTAVKLRRNDKDGVRYLDKFKEQIRQQTAKPPKNWRKYLDRASSDPTKRIRRDVESPYENKEWHELPADLRKEIAAIVKDRDYSNAGDWGGPPPPPGWEGVIPILQERHPDYRNRDRLPKMEWHELPTWLQDEIRDELKKAKPDADEAF